MDHQVRYIGFVVSVVICALNVHCEYYGWAVLWAFTALNFLALLHAYFVGYRR